ncbi:diphosphomevalonate decarboxylase [Lactobacillus sp. Sy-1]|uniref:diphosphomevalonate decarboxylase n=1 Tax=Lactobacillus sp. Sy-1 TaxID=2109645 RepID=UPI001C562613|nr:diphosphomevalonate decarboxylase [Lactobacillus sp. Sy-1]MBW1605600.1 diphosphomevalonate decarboxylase [Lactobacillus sp. Sy-1]
MSDQLVWARAHTNIALVKYWGKADAKLIIPQNSSLSLTLDHFYTDTGVQFDSQLSADQLFIDDVLAPVDEKVANCLAVVRQLAGIKTHALIRSYNHVPNAAGLASSASAFAALATAACKAAGLTLSKAELSMVARRGSGSATRSIFGGFVEWHAGDSDTTSFAQPIEDPVQMDIKMITVVLNRHPKKISSRMGMQSSVNTSPYYAAWKQQAAKDLVNIKAAILQANFNMVGHIAETNAMRMHALTLSADPSFTYFNADSLEAMHIVKSLRENGTNCYFTMDAGPNVKIICQSKDEATIINALYRHFTEDKIVVCKPGPGVTIIKDPR